MIPEYRECESYRQAQWVKLGQGSMLGIGCCVVPEIHVGEWATVGAGGTVVRDVEPNSTVPGIAAKARQTSREN
jgi:serine acetyltransferase